MNSPFHFSQTVPLSIFVYPPSWLKYALYSRILCLKLPFNTHQSKIHHCVLLYKKIGNLTLFSHYSAKGQDYTLSHRQFMAHSARLARGRYKALKMQIKWALYKTKNKTPSHDLSSFPLCPFDSPNFYFDKSFLFVYLLVIFYIFFYRFWWLLELTRVNPDRNIFSINVELTSTFLLYRGLVHHHHRILNKTCVLGTWYLGTWRVWFC